MSSSLRLLIVGLMVALQALMALQSPVTQNYSNDILRLAKAAQIKAYLYEDKNPCDNFYKFACGQWGRSHPATGGVLKTSYLDQLQELYVRKSVDILKGDRKVSTSLDTKLSDFYESCRDKEALRQYGVEPILNVVGFKGGWPRVTSKTWYEYEYDWLRVIAELRRKLGVDILVGLDVIPDFEDKDMHRIKIGAPKLDLGSRAAYLSEDYEDQREDYKESIVTKLRKFFNDMPFIWAKEVADQVVDLETQLAKGLPENSRLTIKQTTRQRYPADLKSAYGNYVDLSRYLSLIFNDTIYAQVYETPEDYLSNLVDVIKNTPKLTIANYTMWRVLEKFEFAGDINRKQNDIWCVQKVIDYFPKELEMMFHRNLNGMHVINELNEVWSDIKKSFKEEILTTTKLNWITLDTRQKFIFKLDAMDLEIITHDDEHLEQQMYALKLKKNTFYENLISIIQWETQHNLAKLIEKPQVNEVELRLPKYERSKNKILIPITFLQGRFFWDPSYPYALKYGTLGFLLAHEMVRGFDALGRRYDKHGYQNSWWDSVSEYAYDERAKCFARQYENYKFKGQTVNVSNANETSIADNGGLSIAYRAYQKWWNNLADKRQEAHETLPLMNYTQSQLFFIGFAQLWCADYSDKVTKFTEVPERLRVIGALANFEHFPREFNCPLGGKMNPEKKCNIY